MLSLEEQIARVVDEAATPVTAAEARSRSPIRQPRHDRRVALIAIAAAVVVAVAIPTVWRASRTKDAIHVGGESDPTTAPTGGVAIGSPIGKIDIPAIDVHWPVIQGADSASEAKGPTHDPDSPLPGAAGNALIAGHRATHGAPFFRLDELKNGDIITFTDTSGESTFTVDGTFTVPETSDALFPASVLDRVEGRTNSLTLITNNPRYSATQRLVVTAHRPSLRNISVPNVIGKTGAEAKVLLGRAHFDSVVVEAVNGEVPVGLVLAQDPVPGATLRENGVVTITVSSNAPDKTDVTHPAKFECRITLGKRSTVVPVSLTRGATASGSIDGYSVVFTILSPPANGLGTMRARLSGPAPWQGSSAEGGFLTQSGDFSGSVQSPAGYLRYACGK